MRKQQLLQSYSTSGKVSKKPPRPPNGGGRHPQNHREPAEGLLLTMARSLLPAPNAYPRSIKLPMACRNVCRVLFGSDGRAQVARK